MMIICEIIFLMFSGICYMSLNVYPAEKRYKRKRFLLAVVLLGISVPVLIAHFTGMLKEKAWGAGLFYASLLVGILAVIRLLLQLVERCRDCIRRKLSGTVSAGRKKDRWCLDRFMCVGPAEDVRQTVTRKELLLLLGLTLLYGAAVFYRLGSTETPQTSLELVADGTSDEIILDFGQETEIASVQVYLGHMLDRVVAVSYYDEEQGEWIPIEEELTMESNYCWNELELHKELRYLGLVSRSGVASYQEIVVLDEDGQKLQPLNTEDYPELFDEQELYPEKMTYYDTTMFDEVYYAGSAYEFLNGMEMYETTHPPMGKILIAIGELLFGVTPFGWRFVCALLGVLAVPLFFAFLYLVTENGRISLLGTVLYCLDFMHYTLSRIATLDSIVAFFILLMVTLLVLVLKKADRELSAGRAYPSVRLLGYMILDGLAVGMGVSTKWTGFYAMLGMAILFLFFVVFWFIRKRRAGERTGYVLWLLLEGVGCYSLLPLGVYLLSFLPQMKAEKAENLFKVMWESSLFMLEFHSDIVFDHPYESPWYTWILDLVPLVDSGNFIGDDKVSMIATFGNPLIWWAGAAVFFYLAVRFVRHHDKRAGLLCFCYLMMLVPWFFVKRTVFIYQYYVSSIFLCGMVGYSLYLLGRTCKYLIPAFLETAFFLILIFFPVISGVPVRISHVLLYLQWFESWTFVVVRGT